MKPRNGSSPRKRRSIRCSRAKAAPRSCLLYRVLMNTEPSSVVDVYSRWLAALTCACMLVMGAPSAFGAEDAADPFTHSQAVPDPELEELRGGFLTSAGLEIRFGLEQIVLDDGTLATRSSHTLTSHSHRN